MTNAFIQNLVKSFGVHGHLCCSPSFYLCLVFVMLSNIIPICLKSFETILACCIRLAWTWKKNLYLKFEGGFKRGIMFQQAMEQSQAQKFQFASKSTISFRCILFTLHYIQQAYIPCLLKIKNKIWHNGKICYFTHVTKLFGFRSVEHLTFNVMFGDGTTLNDNLSCNLWVTTRRIVVPYQSFHSNGVLNNLIIKLQITSTMNYKT